MEVADQYRLDSMLEALSLKEKSGIAVAVNATVVPRKDWPQFNLTEDDEILIIEAAQGG